MFLALKEDILNAARSGNLAQVKNTLKKAQEMNMTRLVLNSKNDKGETALHLSILGNHENIVDELIKMGCDVNTALNERSNVESFTKDGCYCSGIYEGRSPLMDACCCGNLSIVKKLVEHNAQIDAVDRNNVNAVMFTAQHGYVDILKILLQRDKSMVYRKGCKGTTPLGYAAMNGQLDIAKEIILNWSGDINCRTDRGSTPLIIATRFNHLEIVKFLLENKADRSIKNYGDKAAIDFAREQGNKEIVKLLRNSLN